MAASSPTPDLSVLFTAQPPSYYYGASKHHGGEGERDHDVGVLILSFFSVSLFLTVLYYLYTRWSSSATTSRAATAEATMEEEMDRHVLNIGYGGLFRSELNKKIVAAGLPEDCAICLSKMVVGELVTIMPVCEHGFHSKCVEEWLKTQPTCPMCRTYLIAVPPMSKAAVAVDVDPL
ncbi:hypothetical protein ZOSMA_174G00160 [Zostera marina]|uniref:RING-type domain-containing protein n=1 Tax=Zostera marina TaxID=29655 RepID=A0A0K9PUA4_ZOSMR|nr:hypothetical protein ZOSMA_174G00160 [Zostera marina]